MLGKLLLINIRNVVEKRHLSIPLFNYNYKLINNEKLD